MKKFRTNGLFVTVDKSARQDINLIANKLGGDIFLDATRYRSLIKIINNSDAAIEALTKKVKLLEEYLKIAVQYECAEKLPKYVKTKKLKELVKDMVDIEDDDEED